MAKQKSISGIIGKGSIRHNNRDFYAENVKRERTKDNIILCKEDIHKAYHDLFDEPLAEYNTKQKRKDRIIPDYYEHIRTSKQEKLFYEVIFQIGDMKDTAVGTEDGALAAEILEDFYRKFEAENPHIHIFNAVIHMDEATPHLHIDFIPVATESKRGLSTRNSLSKALEQQGFKSEGKLNTCSKLWIDSEKKRLSECMAEHGIEHEKKDIHRSNLSVEEYKLRERIKKVAELEEKISEKEGELDAISKKQLQIQKLDEISVENTVIGDKVKISRNDFNLLLETAKKYYARRKTADKLRNRVSTLEGENLALRKTVEVQKKEISKLKSIRERLNIGKLQTDYNDVKAKLEKIMEFIDFMGLREKFEKFLHRDRSRPNQIDR